jgi:hypothetical protein
MEKFFAIYTPGIVSVIYAATGLYYMFAKKDYAWFLIWFSYATANIGLIWAAIRQ